MTSHYIPPWQDISTLCANVCASERTIDAWVRQGLLPPPRMVGGKRLWKWADVEARTRGFVYFIDGGSRIKIGYTRFVEKRLDALQRASPVHLTLVGLIPGNKVSEEYLHLKFIKIREHGEWFCKTPELLHFIKGIIYLTP